MISDTMRPFSSKGAYHIYHVSVIICCTYAPCVLRSIDALSCFFFCFFFHFKVLQNATWFGLTGLKGNIIRVL